MGTEATVIQVNGFPGQAENRACVEAEKDGAWHFPSPKTAEAGGDSEQPGVLTPWGWLEASHKFLGCGSSSI